MKFTSENKLLVPFNGLYVVLTKDGFMKNIIFFSSILILFLIINKLVTKKFFDKNTFIFFVLLIIMEIVNTCIELIADFMYSEYSSKIKDIKDIGATATISIWFLYALYLILFYT
tara:strand:- start:365 stop:709 length:345 start_codon:yes stop_codon:yes gene_type:complete